MMQEARSADSGPVRAGDAAAAKGRADAIAGLKEVCRRTGYQPDIHTEDDEVGEEVLQWMLQLERHCSGGRMAAIHILMEECAKNKGNPQYGGASSGGDWDGTETEAIQIVTSDSDEHPETKT